MPTTPKGEDTGLRILDAALDLFREQGFDAATMREIAARAGVATGAAYYYYPSKEAIVMDFYRRSSAGMQPKIEAAMQGSRNLEQRLRAVIRVKLDHFAPNRAILRALLRNGADPRYALSPFSLETKTIRDADIEWFHRIVADGGIRLPGDLEPHLPSVLWFFQMGVIYFWVTDESEGQARTARLADLACKSVVFLLRVAALPLMRPLRKTAVQIIELVTHTEAP